MTNFCDVIIIVCRAYPETMFNFTVDDGLEDEEVNMRNGREKGEFYIPSSLSFVIFIFLCFQTPSSFVISLLSRTE